MTKYAKAFHVSVETVDSTTTVNRVTACVRGLHVSYRLRVGVVSGQVAEARQLDDMSGGANPSSPCEGSCRRSLDLRQLVEAGSERLYRSFAWGEFTDAYREKYGVQWEEALTLVREYYRRCFEDGDSDEALLCSGRFHIRRVCTEFGMGSSYSVIGGCDHGCRRRRVRLPSSVARGIGG